MVVQRASELVQIAFCDGGGDSKSSHKLVYDRFLVEMFGQELKDHGTGRIERKHFAVFDIHDDSAVGGVSAAYPGTLCWHDCRPRRCRGLLLASSAT
jgi:hypothetical protein